MAISGTMCFKLCRLRLILKLPVSYVVQVPRTVQPN